MKEKHDRVIGDKKKQFELLALTLSKQNGHSLNGTDPFLNVFLKHLKCAYSLKIIGF